MEVKFNSRTPGKNYLQFKKFFKDIEELKIGGVIGIVTNNKTITLIKQKEIVKP